MTMAVTKARETKSDGRRSLAPDSFFDEVVAGAVVEPAAAEAVLVADSVADVPTVSPEEECELNVVLLEDVVGALSETELVVSPTNVEVDIEELGEAAVVCAVDVLSVMD